MKFLLVTHIYPPAVDGGSRVIAKVGEYLHKNGHNIMVLTSNCNSTDDFVNPKSKPIHNSVNGSHLTDHIVTRLPVHKHLRRPLKLLRLFLSLFINHKSYIINLIEILEKGPIFKFFPFLRFLVSSFQFHPDCIIAGPLPTTIVLYARLIRFLTGSKLLINSSFHPTDPIFHRPPLINTLKSADLLWTLTDFETNYFHTNFQIPHSKMINVGNGIDSSFLASSPEICHLKSEILYVGSFAAHKNILLLIDAFTILSSKFPDLTLTLAGQKTLYWPVIKHQIDNLPPTIKKKIHLIFNFSDDRQSTLYDQCTILIQPSLQESFGLTIIEAWARRRSVIVSDIPSSIELITKSDGGILFKRNDPRDLSQKNF